MIPCICGHGHLSGATCHCGCTIYEPDDGTDGPHLHQDVDLAHHEPYVGQYHPAKNLGSRSTLLGRGR